MSEAVAPQGDSREPSRTEMWENGTCAGQKSAPESLTRSEGLTTGTSPFDLTEGGKPMASRNVTPLTGSAAAKLDGCPACVINTEVPYGGWTEPNGSLVCVYVCSDCGHRWHTSWNDEVA
jgi:hypothetical protein